MSYMPQFRSGIFWKFSPFWLFLIFFKFGGGLHYSLLSTLGDRLMPLWIVGLLVGATSFVELLLDVPAGHLLDRYGYRKLLRITTLIFITAALCFVFGFSITIYLISLLLASFGWLFFSPGMNAYILSHAPKEHAGSFIAMRDIFSSVGIVLSSATLAFAILLTPEYLGYLLTVLLLIALVMISLSPKDVVSVHAEKKLPTHHHYIRRHPFLTTLKAIKRLNPASTMLLLLGMTSGIFYGVIWFVVPLVIAHQALSGLLSIGLGVFDFSVVVLGFFLGNLADKANKRTLVFFGLLLFSLAGMFIGFHFTWVFLLLGFLATAGDEMAGLSLWSWLHALDHNHDEDGLVSGVISMFGDLGWTIGPIAAGILYGLVGPSWAILIGASPIFVLWIVYQFMVRKHSSNLSNVAGIPKQPIRFRHKA